MNVGSLKTVILRMVPTFAHFGRCWHHLHRRQSRRSVEVGMVWMFLAMVARLLHSMGELPTWQALSASPSISRLVIAGDEFYRTLWPSPEFWVAALLAGMLLSLAGLHQVVAAVQLTHARGNPAILAEDGEDNARYWASVHTGWLLADIFLRRAGMWCGIGFFATLAWVLFVHAGIWNAGLFVGLCAGCIWVDNKLFEAQEKHQTRIAERKQVEREALLLMAYGQENPSGTNLSISGQTASSQRVA